MAFCFSKEEREKRASDKEIAKKDELQRKQEHKEFLKNREQELLDMYIKERNEYCEWFTEKTNLFKNELSQKNFHANMGFEVEDVINSQYGIGSKQIEDVSVFDISEISGVAFDYDSKQMIYFKSTGQYYENYNEYTQPIYEYILIKFNEIINVKIDIDSVTMYETTHDKDIIKRCIAGGLLAGSAGAIIGGMTAHTQNQNEILPREIIFTIQTTNKKLEVISFEFNRSYYYPNSKVFSEQSLVDTMISIFADNEKYIIFSEDKIKRKCGTDTDYIYKRVTLDNYDKNSELIFMKEKRKIAHLQIIAERLNKYAMQIESIIHQNNNVKDNIPINSISDEIAKLVLLKESGALSEEEFNTLKAKIIDRQ